MREALWRKQKISSKEAFGRAQQKKRLGSIRLIA
jgi:hypothetical protein